MKKEIVSIRLNESELEYLNELVEQGYNRSAIIRKGLNLFKHLQEKLQDKKLGGLNGD